MSSGRRITIVAAMARNRAIGLGGTMPWHLPAELRHFKETTMGKPIVMGRRTWDSIGRALPDMLSEASSLTLPLLGTGQQQIDPTRVARELLSALPRWASNPRLRTVRVVTHNLEHVAILNRALDDRDFFTADER